MMPLKQIIKRVYENLLARIRALESGYVPASRTVNGYALSSNVTVTTNDVAPEVVSHGTSDTGTSSTAYEIAPNKLHTWGTVTALYLSLGSAVSGRVNEYMIRFTAAVNFELSLPANVRWGVEPTFVEGDTYEVSIIDNLAICAEFTPAAS